MSWSFNYLKKLQKEIEGYKDKMAYMIDLEADVANQSNLLEISRKLDSLILQYQNFKKYLSIQQELPYTVDFYMNTKFKRVTSKDGISITANGKNDVRVYIIEDEKGNFKGIINEKQMLPMERFAVCSSGVTVSSAGQILNQTNADFLIVVDEKARVLGYLEKWFLESLLQEKTFRYKTRKMLYRVEDAFDNVPVSIFVLDKDLFIDYANTQAIKNFHEVLPKNFLFRRADLVFSGFFSNNYESFVTGELWKCLKAKQEQTDIEVKLLNYISLLTNIKIVKKNSQVENIVISFVNIDELKQKVDNLTFTTDELSQALSLFFPAGIEKKLRNIPEYKDIYNPETKKITIIAKISDGGYWHVINCLRVLAQIDRTGILQKNKIDKDILVKAFLLHDIGKKQPALKVGQVVDPEADFEKSAMHASRSANYCRKLDFGKEVTLLVKYHHHGEDNLPRNFPKMLLPTFRVFKMIDGLSAAITRRNATINFELSNNKLIIHENNNDRPEYNQDHILLFS